MRVFLCSPPYKIDVNKGYEYAFIRSGSRWPHMTLKKRNRLPHYLPFPFFLAYAATVLRNEGRHDVTTLDGVALDIDRETFLQHCSDAKPDAIFFEITGNSFAYDIELATEMHRMTGARIIVGGPHAYFLSNFVFAHNDCIEAIILGEYEYPLLDYLASIEEARECHDNNVMIRGCERSGKKDIAIIPRIDQYPLPDRENFPAMGMADPGVYWDGFCQRHPTVQMHSSRGCAYHCKFCLWPQTMYGGRKFRARSPENIVGEMAMCIEKYGAREIYFDDDDFLINKKRVRELVRQISEAKLPVKWSCMGDAVNSEPDILEAMAESGCIGMKFGVESGSPEIIEKIGKPVRTDKVRAVVDNCRKFGIKTHGTFMLGFPGETEATIEESRRFVCDLDIDSIQVSILVPQPGTESFSEFVVQDEFDLDLLKYFDGKSLDSIPGCDIRLDNLEFHRRRYMRSWLLSRLRKPSWIGRQLKYWTGLSRQRGLSWSCSIIADFLIDELKCHKTPAPS